MAYMWSPARNKLSGSKSFVAKRKIDYRRMERRKLDKVSVTSDPRLQGAAGFLTAGQLAPLSLEYAAAGGDGDHLHLFVGSKTLDLRHVPSALLYSERPFSTKK